MKKSKIEGYWYSDQTPNYPKPVPNVLTKEQARAIFKLIKEKEQDKKTHCLYYKGFSTSRIDNKTWVGSGEFVTKEWVWPQGFAEHYVLEHKVKPTDEFLEFIGYSLDNFRSREINYDEYSSSAGYGGWGHDE